MLTPRSELESKETLTGFRLIYLELLNWGTFHKNIWAIQPEGYTALLTGANGSGKSTLVDALLTLLVPLRKRGYNKAAGDSRKQERTEKTYVQGAYGRLRSEDGYGTKVQYLRQKDSYTVLLSRFCNIPKEKTVTLAQVLWFDGNNMKKFYVVATKPLAIKEHFSRFDNMSQLKNRLKELDEIELFTDFNKYSKYFRKQFGIRSEKALDLFSQTVMIKEVGNLNRFVRNHMLEQTNVKKRIEKLKQNYDNLNRAYEAIIKAQEQMEKLVPLMKDAKRYQSVGKQLEELYSILRILPSYFAYRKINLLKHACTEEEERLKQANHREAELNRNLDELKQEQKSLDIAISKDNIGQQLQHLEQKIKDKQNWLTNKQNHAEDYNKYAQALDLPLYNDHHTFDNSRVIARKMKREADNDLKKLKEQIRDIEYHLKTLKEKGDELDKEIKSLQQRKSQIPTHNLNLRNRILKQLEIAEEKVLFVGELLQVKPEEKKWEGAIERLLHNFGLNLLVPDEYYHRFSQYVNKNNLRDRLVFHRIVDQKQNYIPPLDSASLVCKLNIKPDNKFYAWLQHKLSHRFDYICCDDLALFHREKRAITVSGFIKREGSLHEKDDRHSIKDRRNYILGWSNKKKIDILQAELKTIRQKYNKNFQELKVLKSCEEKLRKKQNNIEFLLTIEQFNSIDWKSDDVDLRRFKKQHNELIQSADNLKQLQHQLEEIKKQIGARETDHKNIMKKIYDHQRNIKDFQSSSQQAEIELNKVTLDDLQTYSRNIETNLNELKLSRYNIDKLEKAQREWFNRQIKTKETKRAELVTKVQRQMIRYKSTYPIETVEVDDSIEAIDEFSRMLETIKREDLPRHKKRFRKLLGDKITVDITGFQSYLEQQEDEIRDNIIFLNNSLKHIEYNSGTYIQLESEKNRDEDILDFHNLLRDCIPDNVTPDHEKSYKQVKVLIDHFDTRERWATKVTDVRNWLNFAASERYMADDSEKHHYSDSSGKSGGQKSKLAYTILASAIAYQFSLEDDKTKVGTFRFVIVDEAFGKSDEANAHYAMELFKKLGLQLLVVTPPRSHDIHIVEPYISAVHWVEYNTDNNTSHVHNLTMSEYHKEKRSYIP